ncbi:MAG: PilZ domain-containing protein [Gammaproteobacteria bacterium]|nr:MAG: PilZ domain-containing protein [Gammaproteobacteria bacterium]
MSEDQRQHHRINYDTPAIISQGDKEWPTLVIDISVRGLLIWLPDDWDADNQQPFKAVIPLGGNAIIRMDLQLVRASNERAGFQCSHIDAASIEHLKQLLEWNLGDASLVERELSALG